MPKERFCRELVKLILSRKNGKQSLEKLKSSLSRKHGLSYIPRNADIISWAQCQHISAENREKLRKALQTKPVRTGSGVSVIAVMTMGRCPGKCIYCPRGKNSPQSYTGFEPATMRAKRAKYDPVLQVKNRLRQLEVTGHRTEKCELIIMGGTFPSYPEKKQRAFVKGCLDALNGGESESLECAQNANENAPHRCVGMTIETRPDYCKKRNIADIMGLGATRVELGVQAVDDEILRAVCRGHGVAETVASTGLLKDSGLKVCYHLMPGLTGIFGEIDTRREKKILDEVFSNPAFRPDMLKIYPVLLIPGTRLYSMWKAGKFVPMSLEQASEVMVHIKQRIPPWVRIQRMQRDIPSGRIVAGPILTNLRQHVSGLMQKSGTKCMCIRCREVGHICARPENIRMVRREYEASEGREIFLSYEDRAKGILIGYARLRIASEPFMESLKGATIIRELHVYGQEVSLGQRDAGGWQHSGYGRRLVEKAEDISSGMGFGSIAVTSGIGAREYYRRLGYELKGFHMVKILE